MGYFLIIKYLANFRLFYKSLTILYLCLFDLIICVPQSTVFFSYVGMGLPGFRSNKQGLMCLAHGNNAVPPVGLEPERQRCYEELFPKANVMLSMRAGSPHRIFVRCYKLPKLFISLVGIDQTQ